MDRIKSSCTLYKSVQIFSQRLKVHTVCTSAQFTSCKMNNKKPYCSIVCPWEGGECPPPPKLSEITGVGWQVTPWWHTTVPLHRLTQLSSCSLSLSYALSFSLSFLLSLSLSFCPHSATVSPAMQALVSCWGRDFMSFQHGYALG